MGWKESDVPDMTGKTVIVGRAHCDGARQADSLVQVTGGNAGLGYENCRVLYGRGATVIMASRDQTKCQAAVDAIVKANPDGDASKVSTVCSQCNVACAFTLCDRDSSSITRWIWLIWSLSRALPPPLHKSTLKWTCCSTMLVGPSVCYLLAFDRGLVL